MSSLALKGELPSQIIAQVRGEPQGVRLVLSAALAFAAAADEVERLYGWRPHVTSSADALRTYNTQVRIFLERYRKTFAQVTQPDGRKVVDRRVFNDIPYWRWQGAAAAVPGTGNHPKGVAVDVEYMAYGTKRFEQWSEIAKRHGWTNTEGRSVGEAWHWVHEESLRLVNNYITTGKIPSLGAPPTGALPEPLQPEEDDMVDPAVQQQLDRIEEALTIKGAPYQVPEATLSAVQELAVAVGKLSADNKWLANEIMVPGAPYTYFAAILAAVREVAAQVTAAQGGDPVAVRAEIDRAIDQLKIVRDA